MCLASRDVAVSDLVVMKKYSHLKTRQNLHFASGSFGRCHFHRSRFYPEAENRRHWLTEAGETRAFDRYQSGHRSGGHPTNFASWMTQSKYHHLLFEKDLDSADSADAVAVLASLLGVTVADVEQGFVERLVDSPI